MDEKYQILVADRILKLKEGDIKKEKKGKSDKKNKKKES